MNAVEIREKIKMAGLFQYQVAYEIGINEVTFIRWLREPITADRATAIRAAINKLTKSKERA